MEHETNNLVGRLSMKSIYNRRMETVQYRWPACQLTLDLKYSQLIQECKIKWKIMIQRDNTAYWKKYLSTWLSFTRVLGLGGLNITQNIKIWLSGSGTVGFKGRLIIFSFRNEGKKYSSKNFFGKRNVNDSCELF